MSNQTTLLRLLAVLILSSLLAAASCGGGGGAPKPTSGSIAGEITIGGPFNGAVELKVGLFNPGTIEPFDSATAGRVTSTASCTHSGRSVSYSFSDIEFGNYNVGLYSEGSPNTIYYMSEQIALTEDNAAVSGADGQASYTGAGPWGTISGIVLMEGDTSFPSGKVIFIGFAPVDAPQNVLQWTVVEGDVQPNGWLVYNVDHIAYGDWTVALYGYDPATHQVTIPPYGAYDSVVHIGAESPNVAGITFPASFAGDPGTDPALGSISGTVHFTGTIPASYETSNSFIAVIANTTPPQQGAPPASITIRPSQVDGSGNFSFVLDKLPDGAYGVSAIVYDFSTHQQTLLGIYPTNVEISSSSAETGIDFDATAPAA